MAETAHPIDALQEALDGRLDSSVRAALDAHLAHCNACRAEYERLAWTKAQVAAARATIPMPAALPAQIRSTLDNADAPKATTAPKIAERHWWRQPRWGLVAVAAALLVAWLTWPLLRPGAPLPELVAADYRSIVGGALRLGIETAEIDEVEAYFRRAGVPFTTRVFDLGMMRYQVTGGLARRLDGRQSALFAYRGPGGHQIICQMFRGRVEELPPPRERRNNNDIEFLIYHEGSVTVVFWQEGDVVCVLAGDGDAGAVIELAFAKAMKV